VLELLHRFERLSSCRFQFNKRRQLFIRAHNETLSIIAVCINDPDRSPFGVNR